MTILSRFLLAMALCMVQIGPAKSQVSVEPVAPPAGASEIETTDNPPPTSSRAPVDATTAVRPAAEKRDQLSLPTAESIGLGSLSDAVRTTGTKTEDFNDLRSLRNRLASIVERVRSELWEGSRRVIDLPAARDLEQWRDSAEDSLRCARNADCPDYTDLDVPFWNSEIRRYQSDLDLALEAETELPEARAVLSELERLSDELDRKINDALNRDIVEQEFKTAVSLYFTGIVGVMIVLFFALLFYDAKIRNSLFSSPSAIQFVTLFSVVIAIILFGITGILQDKELSALLGGLSGYILGRYSNDSTSNS